MIEKELLLNYLKYSPPKVDIYKLSLWLEANSNKTLKVKKIKSSQIEHGFVF